jgi:hypothetical protein
MRHLAIVAGVCAVLMTGTAPVVLAAQAAGTTLIETGTLARFDATAGILTLSTSRGEQQFSIGSKTRIREGWHHIDAAALSGLAGREIRIRYVETGGQRTVKSVSVSGAKPRRGEEM